MAEQVDTTLPSDVQELDRQVFELANRLRADPRSFIPYLQEMLGRFETPLDPGRDPHFLASVEQGDPTDLLEVQADRIVAKAKEEAASAAETAKSEIASSVDRRLAQAEDQIAGAKAAAIKEVKDAAITVAVAAAKDIMAAQMDSAAANALIDDAIATVGAKLH